MRPGASKLQRRASFWMPGHSLGEGAQPATEPRGSKAQLALQGEALRPQPCPPWCREGPGRAGAGPWVRLKLLSLGGRALCQRRDEETQGSGPGGKVLWRSQGLPDTRPSRGLSRPRGLAPEEGGGACPGGGLRQPLPSASCLSGRVSPGVPKHLPKRARNARKSKWGLHRMGSSWLPAWGVLPSQSPQLCPCQAPASTGFPGFLPAASQGESLRQVVSPSLCGGQRADHPSPQRPALKHTLKGFKSSPGSPWSSRLQTVKAKSGDFLG